MKKINNTCCLIFTKNPEPGKTKTRLIPSIGVEAALNVHKKLLQYTLELTSLVTGIDFLLYTTSMVNNSWLNLLSKQYNLPTFLQSGENLGERMYNATYASLKKYSHCIIIGSDCPELSASYLFEAQQSLKSNLDAVIGPAEDGGYVLIGMNKAHQDVFSNISWGENTVLAETLFSFDRLNLKYKKLAILHDVDTADDLQYLSLIPDKH